MVVIVQLTENNAVQKQFLKIITKDTIQDNTTFEMVEAIRAKQKEELF